MPRYRVTVQRYDEREVEVEADSKENAEASAEGKVEWESEYGGWHAVKVEEIKP